MRPAGASLIVDRGPPAVLPPGCFDTGDGVYDPAANTITAYGDPTRVVRTPNEEEQQWIVEHCRVGV